MTRVTCEGVSRRVARGVVYVLIPFMLSACGNDNTTTPTPTLQGLTVTCAAATLSVFGASTQCAASVRLSNGQTQDQTSTATWSSSNTAIATVSGGLVRAVAQGSATITATYQGLCSFGSSDMISPGSVAPRRQWFCATPPKSALEIAPSPWGKPWAG